MEPDQPIKDNYICSIPFSSSVNSQQDVVNKIGRIYNIDNHHQNEAAANNNMIK